MFIIDLSVLAQNIEDKFIESNGIRLHYLDFGGVGLPIIFMQSFHDDAYEWHTGEMKGIAEHFIKENRVLAQTRRGWGLSDHTDWGYDVATQSEDLLGFMDALGLEKAVLVGRIPANQDMVWIAEHHPERISGLVLIGNPIMGYHSADPEIRAYERAILDMSWDLGDRAAAMRGPRNSWRPHFISDSTVRIDIPALRFLSENDLERLPGGRNLFYLDRMIQMASEKDFEPDNKLMAKAADYFKYLGKDTQRKEYIMNYLLENDPGPLLRARLEIAFGDNLITVYEPIAPAGKNFDVFWEEVLAPFFTEEIQKFISGLRKENQK